MDKNKLGPKTIPFEQMLRDFSVLAWREHSHEALAHLEYEKELELKNKAFALFLKKNGISSQARPLIASPKERGYRTTSKRRVFCDKRGLAFGFSQDAQPGVCESSVLEPKKHQVIYDFLHKTLEKNTYSSLARALNWLIIRGNYERQFLIFNVFKMDAGIVRKLKQLSILLQEEKLLEGAMVYFDPTQSDYYLEAERPANGMQTKHLFGTKLLGLKVNDTLMRYSPLGFSQINESMVPEMVDIATALLNPVATDHILDLYCGYGLFSHTLGKSCEKVTGVEMSASAIDSAREISKRMKTGKKMQFHAKKIDANFVWKHLIKPAKNELILLDPPRKGCEPGVIETLAKRKPKRVLQIFCGTDAIPREIKEWESCGYLPTVIQPVDMFAGTANLETMILFEKKG